MTACRHLAEPGAGHGCEFLLAQVPSSTPLCFGAFVSRLLTPAPAVFIGEGVVGRSGLRAPGSLEGDEAVWRLGGPG